jgi:hypothetical protein
MKYDIYSIEEREKARNGRPDGKGVSFSYETTTLTRNRSFARRGGGVIRRELS